MSFNHNHVSLAGNLTRDPELREAGSSQVAKFAIAINRRWRDREGQQQEETTYVDCEAWGRTAEIVGQYLSKGRPVFVEGRLKLDIWDDQEGKRQSRMKVVATNVQFLPDGGRRGDAPARSERPQAVRETVTSGPAGDDDEGEPPF